MAALSVLFAGGIWSFGAAAQDAVSFGEDVFPILELRCLECHVPGGEGYEKSGLLSKARPGVTTAPCLVPFMRPS